MKFKPDVPRSSVPIVCSLADFKRKQEQLKVREEAWVDFKRKQEQRKEREAWPVAQSNKAKPHNVSKSDWREMYVEVGESESLEKKE